MIILIPFHTTLQTNMVPEGLINIIDHGKWNTIATNINKTVSEGTFLTFATEFGICICTGFFCIFGCHICISNMIIENRLNDCLHRLNSTVFFSQSVLSIQGYSIAVNTDVIQENLFSPASGNIRYAPTVPTNNNFNQPSASHNFSYTQPTNNVNYNQPTAPIYNQNIAQVYPINTNAEMLYPDNCPAFYPEATIILNDTVQPSIYNKF